MPSTMAWKKASFRVFTSVMALYLQCVGQADVVSTNV
jgi:hypothetical protein